MTEKSDTASLITFVNWTGCTRELAVGEPWTIPEHDELKGYAVLIPPVPEYRPPSARAPWSDRRYGRLQIEIAGKVEAEDDVAVMMDAYWRIHFSGLGQDIDIEAVFDACKVAGVQNDAVKLFTIYLAEFVREALKPITPIPWTVHGGQTLIVNHVGYKLIGGGNGPVPKEGRPRIVQVFGYYKTPITDPAAIEKAREAFTRTLAGHTPTEFAVPL